MQTVLAVTILQQGFFAVAWLVLAALRMAWRASLTWGVAILLLTAGMALVLARGGLHGHALEGDAPVQTGMVFGFLAMSPAMNFAMGALVMVRLVNRLRRPFALLSIDIDHFKAVNDRHGHVAGDQVLVGVAQVLRREARGPDVVARMGGEEFALLLPDTGAQGARKMAQRLLEALREAEHEVDGQRLQVTISLGLAVVTDPAESAQALWRRVDAALYRAKAAGRDRIVAAD